MEVRLDNVKTVIEKKISEDGRIYGFKEFTGLIAKVCIMEETKPEIKK